MKEKTGSTVYKRKWGRAMQQKLPLEGKEAADTTRRDARMCDVSLLRKLDFSRLHARTTTSESQTTENCPFHKPRDSGDARLNYVCIKVRSGIRRPGYCEVVRHCFAQCDLYPGGGTLEKEETLKRLKLPQIFECSFKRQVPVNYDL
ncbi:hypothetical protein ALC57_18851 [Trachymyrmex cornetzi]|uniref:Uncharacterized protein n=1 Tax=Trachymyrmex cornetzi TaxID=471704 RepID=A0A195D7M3_9HYME|nr:hypothetical protein ALC57_18851 [Trachymyrmex cornetzi]